MSAAKDLSIPIVVTTQNAARLGETVPELGLTEAMADPKLNVKLYDKTLFSMLTPQVKQALEELNRPKSVILCGIEAHVCILQTCLDLLHEGYDVHVVSDAVSSSTSYNRDVGIEVRVVQQRFMNQHHSHSC